MEVATRPLLFFAPSLYTYYRRIIFTHRAIHSRLTTGDVTPLVLCVLFLSLFFLRLFLHRSPFRKMQVFLPCRVSRRGGRSSLLMLAEWIDSLKVGHFGFSKSWSCMTSNFLSSSSSRPWARKGTGKEERKSCVDVIPDDKKSHNYSMATLRRRYLRSKWHTLI